MYPSHHTFYFALKALTGCVPEKYIGLYWWRIYISTLSVIADVNAEMLGKCNDAKLCKQNFVFLIFFNNVV